jgi:cell division septation protein DedD
MGRVLTLVAALLFTFLSPAWADILSGAKSYRAGDYPAALAEFRALAADGEPLAQFALGLMYSEGTGVSRDFVAATEWYRQAAENGHAQGQYNLGVAYYTGIGVPRDYAKAVYWYNQAARQGDARSQNNMGYMYESGKGVPQDYVRSVAWYQLAAEGGNVNAQVNLGNAYRTGRGVEANHDQAIAWLRKAVDQWETSDPLKLWIVESPQSIKAYPESVGASPAVQIAEDENIIDDPSADESETQLAATQAEAPAVEETVVEAPVVEQTTEEIEPPTEVLVAEAAPLPDSSTPTTKHQYELIDDAKTSSATAGFSVQLGAFRNPDNAQRGWARLRNAHPDLLSELPFDLSLYVSKVDLGEEMGVWFRVLTGPFTAKTEAYALCNELRDRAVDCLVRP